MPCSRCRKWTTLLNKETWRQVLACCEPEGSQLSRAMPKSACVRSVERKGGSRPSCSEHSCIPTATRISAAGHTAGVYRPGLYLHNLANFRLLCIWIYTAIFLLWQGYGGGRGTMVSADRVANIDSSFRRRLLRTTLSSFEGVIKLAVDKTTN